MKQACLTLQVDRTVYQKAIAVARPTLTAMGIPDEIAASLERYSLNENDCINFAMKVAEQLRSVGLKIPARSALDTPASYIAKLEETNP